MKVNSLVFVFTFFAAVAAFPSQAQMTSTGSASPSPSQATPGGRAGRVQCWQQAGISQSTVEEYRTMMRSTRQEVESVCSNSSLSQSEKQQKVQLLHTQARQQMESMVTPQQLESFESCQKQHGEHRGGLGAGGCGTQTKSAPAMPTQ
jgi:Spy/CpxP family protein refolding chaperone